MRGWRRASIRVRLLGAPFLVCIPSSVRKIWRVRLQFATEKAPPHHTAPPSRCRHAFLPASLGLHVPHWSILQLDPSVLQLVVGPQVVSEVRDVLHSDVLVDRPDLVSAHQRQPNSEREVLARSVHRNGRLDRNVLFGEVAGGRRHSGAVEKRRRRRRRKGGWRVACAKRVCELRGAIVSNRVWVRLYSSTEVQPGSPTHHMMFAPDMTNLIAPRSTPTRGRRAGSAKARERAGGSAQAGEG